MTKIDDLKNYKKLLDEGVITQEEFNKQKDRLLNDSVDVNEKRKNTSQKTNNNDTTLLTCLGVGCAIISLFIVPILFGAGGIICGYLLTQKKPETKERGVIIMILSVAFCLLGVLLGIATYA